MRGLYSERPRGDRARFRSQVKLGSLARLAILISGMRCSLLYFFPILNCTNALHK